MTRGWGQFRAFRQIDDIGCVLVAVTLSILAFTLVSCTVLDQTTHSTPDPTVTAENRQKVCGLVADHGYEKYPWGTHYGPIDSWDRQPLAKVLWEEFSHATRGADLLVDTSVQFSLMYNRGGRERSVFAVPAAFWRVGDNLYNILGLDCDLTLALVESDDHSPGCSLWHSYRSGEIGRDETVEQYLAQLDSSVFKGSHRLLYIMNAFYAASLLMTEVQDDDQVKASFNTVVALGDDECGL